MRIKVNQKEYANRILEKRKIEAAIHAIRTEGYVVLENAIQKPNLEELRKVLDNATKELIKENKGVKLRFTQEPPQVSQYVFPEVVANPFVNEISRCVLGNYAYNNLYNVNTNCPGSYTQPVHRDAGHLWADQAVPHPTASLMINISLGSVKAINGPIEIWPYSHLDPDTSIWIDEERQKSYASKLVCTNNGDILIRDIRLWHRGTPNISNRPRHMISMSHHIYWLERGVPLPMLKESKESFSGTGIKPYFDFKPQLSYSI